MIRGRKKLSVDQRTLRGNPGEYRIDHRRLPALTPALMHAPEGLSPVARVEYRRVGRLLRDARIISRLDRTAVMMYAVAYANWLAAEAKAPGSPNAHRWMTALASRCDALGLLPAGRTRIQTLPDVGQKAADPIEGIFRSGQAQRKVS